MATLNRTATVMAMTLVLGSSIAANAAPPRFGGFAVPRAEFHSRVFNNTHGFGYVHGFPNGYGSHVVFYRGGVYDPFWGAYYPYGLFPFAYYPYGIYAYGRTLDSDVKLKVTPKKAEVFVDGYFAGTANQRVHVTPGGHAITLYLDGYRTLTRSVYAGPDSTVTLTASLEPLGAGETSAPPVPPQSPEFDPIPTRAPSASRS